MRQDDYKKGSISYWENAWLQKKATFSFTKPVDDWAYFDLFKCAYLEKLFFKNKNILSLECGCGSGSVSVYFASKGVKTTMLDAAPSALGVAKGNFYNHKLNGFFIDGNTEKLPFSNEIFDLVMSFGLLEHFEDMRPTLREMVRVLKTNGIFFASVSPKKYSIQMVGNLINAFLRFLYHIKHHRFKDAFLNSYPPKPDFYENSFSSRRYIQLISECGLKNVRLSGSRPFPSLDLPWHMHDIYILIMKILRPLHIFFETHPSKLTETIGVEWNIVGIKK